ncbi:hypothetical protein TVAG_374890 [Trichomonas vaginalis G3]|uniref:DUF4704 domain-containing protein n=1 Tax=Trichomonas vaginalis (strain ATCC PRA-98 / G3) TaxID=412133 RepID=A2G4A5_TRIV3|nr:aggrephagy protein [Trichomonas vaginalis G3]EAX88018.1 hypothetical protein TVAG_374890 [Trichomonas vaginalis G3]KAI5494775.1 aggrephagy protein [Trichomonas vaginalis G3]|eukprot:XP_001300948.1 hypothetical protein [Trichomonas vaginalis G3]
MFQNSSEITDYITFPEHQSLLDCISPSLLNSLAIIEEIYLRSQVLSQKFIEVYAKKLPTYFDKENALEQITMFTYVCVVIFQSFPVYINPQALWNNIIFSGHYTAFNPSETYLFLNNFRQLYIRFLVEPQKCTCSYFFKRAAEYPLIFAEMVHRLIQYSLHKYIDPAKAAQITVGLMNPLIQYRDMEYTEPIIKARKAVITFLIRCFRQKETAYAFFVNKDFLRKAFCLFFENSLVKGILSIFFNYINSSQKIENITEIVEIINEFVMNVFQKMPTSEGLKLLVSFLKELNDSLMYKPQYVNNFISLIELLCKKVITLGDDVDREDILIQVISLMAVTSHEHSIKIRELTAIEAAILSLNNNNPKNDIMIKLAQIIAKRPLSFVLPNFDIQQPNVLILFLRIYLKSEKLMDVINFLINLCDFSPENCTKCHDGDLDIFIIDVIDQWRINGGISNEIVNRMLDLLLKIILVTASVSVMQKFFSLFCPINGQNLPYYFSDIISTFNRALISVNKSPLAYIMVDNNSSAKIHGVNADNLNNGLTFSFWFYPIQNNVVTWKQYLFICQDSNGHCLKLILQNKTLIVRLQKGYDHYKGTFELHYSNLMWQLISISYKIGNDDDIGCSFTCFINGKMSKRLNRFPMIEFKNPLNVLINECSKNRPIMEKPCRIGQIILTSELNLNEMQTIVDDGPRGLQTMPLSLIFAIEGVENNGYFGFVNKFTKGITIESKLKNVREDTRFALILVNMVKIENIIPLFALINLTSPQNEKVPFLLENFIDILKNILLLGQMAQNYFVEANGFSIISHLLTKSDTSNLTYKIYLRFYDLLQVITKTSLQKQLYDEILLNENLWILATPKNHLMILRHWARIISDENLITEIKTLRYFLYVLKKFYYFKPSDDSFIVKERPQNLSIDDCRRSIYEVMTFLVSQQKFDDFDFKAIDFNAMISEEEESLSLLSYLSNLVFSHETPSYFYEICFNNLKLLYKFIEESHDAKVLLTINVISEIFKRIPEKRDKLKVTVIECMKLLDVNVISQSFFTQILSLTNGGFPEFLPLVIWSAINCGKSTAMDLIKSLKPNAFYKTDLTSLFWSIVLLYFVEKSDRQTVISFLLQIFNDNWKDLFFTLQAVGLGFKVKKTMEELRFLFVKMILEKVDDKNLNDIFVISSHFILFHQQSSHFISSEFENQKVFAVKSKKRDVISFSKPKNEEEILDDYFKGTNVKKTISLSNISHFVDENKTLSLNINNKNQWKDEDFAKRLLQILLNNPKQEFVNFILILSYFMRKNQLKNSNLTFLTPLDSIQPFFESKEELQFSAALIDPKVT